MSYAPSARWPGPSPQAYKCGYIGDFGCWLRMISPTDIVRTKLPPTSVLGWISDCVESVKLDRHNASDGNLKAKSGSSRLSSLHVREPQKAAAAPIPAFLEALRSFGWSPT